MLQHFFLGTDRGVTEYATYIHYGIIFIYCRRSYCTCYWIYVQNYLPFLCHSSGLSQAPLILFSIMIFSLEQNEERTQEFVTFSEIMQLRLMNLNFDLSMSTLHQ